jgi:hypothetical protein
MEQNRYDDIKKAVNQLLKIKATVKRRKKAEADKQKELFINILIALQAAQTRTNLLFGELKVDFTNYDELFLQIIDSLLLFNFGKEGFEVISFWLYEKISPDGSVNELYDDDNNLVPSTTPEDVWNILQKLKLPEKK